MNQEEKPDKGLEEDFNTPKYSIENKPMRDMVNVLVKQIYMVPKYSHSSHFW